jgi:hypothetical protein
LDWQLLKASRFVVMVMGCYNLGLALLMDDGGTMGIW